jgi:molybdate transport system substrate-binding protein
MLARPRRPARWTWLLCVAATVAACKSSSAANQPIRVVAAASLLGAFEEVAAAFAAKSGSAAVISPGSSGELAVQMREGAPCDVFAAADESYVDQVIRDGVAVADSKRLYAYGRLVAWTPPGTAPPVGLADLVDPRFVKIALASPDNAPYGRAAKQALVRAGVWDRIADRVVIGSNVLQAFQFASTGNADVAFTALSVVMGAGGAHVIVDDTLHDPLAHAMVMCQRAARPDVARAFIDFVDSPDGHAILSRHGLTRPGAPTAPAPAPPSE